MFKLDFKAAVAAAIVLMVPMSGLAQASQGRAYSLQGSAQAKGGDCYLLTEDVQWQNGTIWYKKKLDLTLSFDIEFTMNFGTKDEDGADGMVFVLQTQGSTAIGQQGQGMGFKDFSPSLGVEFDTYTNSYEADPAFDHVAVVSNGSVDHESVFNLAGPVQALATHPNLEDGADHLVRIRWKVPQNVLEVYVDCSKRLSTKVDMGAIFGDQSEVFWGFTGATGGNSNPQSVCLREDIVVQNRMQACPGEVVQLLARSSYNGHYRWSPSALLSDPSGQNPTLQAERSQLFTVEYQDACNQPSRDSIWVEVPALPALDLGPDRTICSGEVHLEASPAATLPNSHYRWTTGDTTQTLSVTSSGTYGLTLAVGKCTVTDTVVLNFQPSPELPDSYEPAVLCLSDPTLRLVSLAAGQGLSYRWSHSDELSGAVWVDKAGTYEVTSTNTAGCAVKESFVVTAPCSPILRVPDAFSPNADGHNDELSLFSSENLALRFWIYDRWGKVLFFSNNPDERWNGYFEGVLCPPDTYVWKAEVRHKHQPDADVTFKTGLVWLIR